MYHKESFYMRRYFERFDKKYFAKPQRKLTGHMKTAEKGSCTSRPLSSQTEVANGKKEPLQSAAVAVELNLPRS